MRWKQRLLRDVRLYLILDRQVNDDGRLFEIAKESIRWGVDMIQLRDKAGASREILESAQKILKLTKGHVPFIVNDRVDLALASGAGGVHLGQDDLPCRLARRMMGRQALIGVSCQTYRQAQQAQEEGADYIGFGSVFKTLTKPERQPMDLDLLAKVVKHIRIPVFAIGGIGLENIAKLQAIGVDRFAVCRAICKARDIRKAVSDLKKEMCGH